MFILTTMKYICNKVIWRCTYMALYGHSQRLLYDNITFRRAIMAYLRATGIKKEKYIIEAGLEKSERLYIHFMYTKIYLLVIYFQRICTYSDISST